MHFSWYLRPAFLAFAAYALLLAAERARFGPPNPPSCDPFYGAPAPVSELRGRIAPYPRKADGATWAELEILSRDGSAACGKAMAVFPADSKPEPGALVSASGTLVRAGYGQGLGGPGYKRHLRSQGIYTVLDGASFTTLARPTLSIRAVNRLRERTLDAFEKTFGRERGAVLSGITLGEKASLSRELNRAFRDSGAMHILVASGSNVGMVTLLAFFLARLAGIGRLWAGLAAIMLAGFYTLLAGADTPLVRAYFMAVFATSGFLLERESGMLHGLVLAALFLTAADPQLLFRPDFQMSFACTAAILIAVSAYSPPEKTGWLGRNVFYIFIAGAAAQLALYPLMASYFHRVSLAPLVSNFLIMPLSCLVMSGGLALAFLAWIPPLFKAAAAVMALPLDFLIWLVRNSAAWGLSFETVRPSAQATACFYASVLLLLHLPQRQVIGKLWKPAALFAVAALLAVFLTPKSATALVFGTARERSLLLKTADGRLFLFGAGINGDILADATLEMGSRKLDALFLTASGPEGAAGLQSLAKRIKISEIYGPYGPMEPELSPLLDKAKALWPGESAALHGLNARLGWPFWLDSRLRQRTFKGYSGTGSEAYSWVIALPGTELSACARLRCAKVRAGRNEFDIIFRRGNTVEMRFPANAFIYNEI